MKFRQKQIALSAALGVAVSIATLQQAKADAIPYPNVGTLNTATYTFTAATTGDIVAYFAGSTASFDNQLGLLVNGVAQGGFGLDNHSSALGQSYDFGSASAGALLTFVLKNNSLGENAYSDPTLNVGYDNVTYTGSHQHVYSTAYTATSPVIDSIPTGTFVAFEDQPFPGSDFNYNDETFVFTGVSEIPTTVPEPATLALLGGLLGAVGLRRRRSR